MREGSILYFTKAEYYLSYTVQLYCYEIVLVEMDDNLAYRCERDYIPRGKGIQLHFGIGLGIAVSIFSRASLSG